MDKITSEKIERFSGMIISRFNVYTLITFHKILRLMVMPLKENAYE